MVFKEKIAKIALRFELFAKPIARWGRKAMGLT